MVTVNIDRNWPRDETTGSRPAKADSWERRSNRPNSPSQLECKTSLAFILAAAVTNMHSSEERLRIDREVTQRIGKDTNFFQDKIAKLIQPSGVTARQDGDRVEVRWNTAYASADAIRSYEVRTGDRLLLSLPHRPQLTEEPFKASNCRVSLA